MYASSIILRGFLYASIPAESTSYAPTFFEAFKLVHKRKNKVTSYQGYINQYRLIYPNHLGNMNVSNAS